jgi:hypothetical protein
MVVFELRQNTVEPKGPDPIIVDRKAGSAAGGSMKGVFT